MRGISSFRIVFKVVLGAFLFKNANCQQTIPTAYASTTKLNYVRSWAATAPIASSDTLFVRPIKDVKQTTGYFDGLAMPVETVVKQGSLATGNNPTDMVSPTLYDVFGRESYKYLSFASLSNDGSFKFNPYQQQDSFMRVQLTGQNQSWFYSQTNFEASPLSRIQKTLPAGNSWVGASRGIETKYWINTVSDSVKKWIVTDVVNGFGTYSTSSSYPAGELLKNVTVDENGKQIIEFKDKKGVTILRKLQLTASADGGTGAGYTGWLSTYYIYDNSNNLRCVVQPEGVKALISNSWIFASTNLDEQCFRYEYDKRNRVSAKKVPGSGIVYQIYDTKDRVVMAQDSVMRAAHKWLYTEYDQLDRPISTGLMTDNTNYNNAAYHRGLADTSSKYPNTNNYTIEILSNTFYDNYDWRSSYGNPLSNALDNAESSYWLSASNTVWPYAQAIVQSSRLKGLVTGSRIKILGTSTYLYTINFYDEDGRTVQVQSNNAAGGTDIKTTQYSWSDQPLQVIMKSSKGAPNPQTTITISKVTYDDIGRVIKTEKKISNTKVNNGVMPSVWTVTGENQYDALGQLKNHKLGRLKDANNSYGTSPVDSLTYEYNIRSWILGANRSYVKDTSSTSNYFGFDLGYDKDTIVINGTNKFYTDKQYSGNITGMLWKSTGDDQIRKYDFSYDAANRLTNANFTQLTSNSFSLNAGIDFSAKGLSFDDNGNILSLNQKGWKLGGSLTIDSLLYTYNTGSNKLKNVLDRLNDTATKLGDFRSSRTYMQTLGNNKTSSAADYGYDPNGNLKLDNNKDISIIYYNHLNLPDSIIVIGKGSIKYSYNASGEKVSKIVHEASKPDRITLYIGGLVYENDTLQFVAQEEGRIRFKKENNTFHYDYFVKDHLGNIRMVLTDEQRMDAYPAATMESATIASESAYYGNLTNTQYSKPTWFSDPVFPSSAFVARVTNTTGVQKVGPNMLLKVMASDTINIRVASGWSSASSATNNQTNVLNDLFSLLTAGLAAQSDGKATQTGLQNGSSGLQAGVQSFLNSQTTSGTKPKAYINWIFFDEQFKVVAGSSGFEQVGGSGATTPHVRNGLVPTKSGYLYIYTSNEATNIDVFFDNLQVTHKRGRVLEETHYYPFGLTMAGISDHAANSMENKKKYNGIEFDSGLDVNTYEAYFRNLDPQIGRWWEIDPKVDNMEMWSPYVSNYNNPILFSDILGDEGETCCMGFGQQLMDWLVPAAVKKPDGAAAITIGISSGVVNFGKSVVEAPVNAFKGPNIFTSVDGMVQAGTDFGATVYQRYDKIKNGSTIEKAEAITQTALELAAAEEGVRFTAGAVSPKITLYRGVNESNLGYGNAAKGKAVPRGGDATPAEHQGGNTQSPYTSWTTDPNVAVNFAVRGKSNNGVVMAKTVNKSSTIKTPGIKNVQLIQSGKLVSEAELLLKGTIKNAQVKQVSISSALKITGSVN